MAGFENPGILLLIILGFPGLYFAWEREVKTKKIIGVTKFLTITLLVLAGASPFITAQENIQETASVTVLEDNSRSSSLMEDVDLKFEDINVKRKVIASGNSSELKSGILRNVEENKAYLLSSDLQSSERIEGIKNRFNKKNSTLNAIKPEMKEEASVYISGPSSTVPEAESVFRIRVHSTSGTPEPEVLIDGEKVNLERASNNSWKFTDSFSSPGKHQIRASIDADDRFKENNRFYKTVKVREKPDVLVLGEEGQLGSELEKFYEVGYRDSVPEDLSKFYTVVAKKSFEEEQLASYVAEGNGLIYTGDVKNQNSLLPVSPIESEEQSKGAKIVLAIDVSKGTGGSGSLKESISIAFSLVDRLPFNNRVGAVAYNREARLLEKPASLVENRRKLKTKISRLEPSGPSYHQNGIKGASQLLNGTGNIVMISDGEITSIGSVGPEIRRKTKKVASELDVRLITVGTGAPDERNQDLLQELAIKGKGIYLDPEDSGRLNFVFTAGGAEDKASQITVIDKNHFITKNLEADTSVAGFDPVKPKRSGRLLATSRTGKPFLTSWRYGLGRVATFTADGSGLPQTLRYDPLLLTRSVSWTVGEPQRKEDRWIRIKDSRRDENVKVRASYEVEGLTRQSENLYTGELDTNNVGFHRFEEEVYSYNYNAEIQEIGYSNRLEDIVQGTGGNVYTQDDKESIAEDAKNLAERKIETKKPLSDYFVLAALIIFLGEIGYRKINGKK